MHRSQIHHQPAIPPLSPSFFILLAIISNNVYYKIKQHSCIRQRICRDSLTWWPQMVVKSVTNASVVIWWKGVYCVTISKSYPILFIEFCPNSPSGGRMYTALNCQNPIHRIPPKQSIWWKDVYCVKMSKSYS